MSPQVQATSSAASRALFNIVSLGPGLVGLPMLLLAVFFGKNTVRRGAVYLSFIITVWLLGLSLGLLSLAGQQDELYPRSRSLCFVQTALVDGALAMTPVSNLALVLQLGIGLLRMNDGAEKDRDTRSSRSGAIIDISFIILPYVAFVVYALRDIMYFVKIETGSPSFDVLNPAFYCKLSTVDPFIPLAATETPLVVFIVVVSCLTLLAEGCIAYLLWRGWNGLRTSGKENCNPIPLGSLIRLTLFTLYRIAIFVVAVEVVRDPRIFPVAEFFHGAIPFVVFVIFGLQRDILSTWLGWATAPFHRSRQLPRSVIRDAGVTTV